MGVAGIITNNYCGSFPHSRSEAPVSSWASPKCQFRAFTALLGELAVRIVAVPKEAVQKGQGPGDGDARQHRDHKVVEGCVVIS